MEGARVRAALIWIVAALGAALIAFGAIGCGGGDEGAPALEDPTATSADLVDEYFSLLAARDTEGLDEFLSEAFIVQRSDGSSATKDEYLADYPEVGQFRISDLTARQDGDALVVRYDSAVEEERIEGERFTAAPAPRLSTFVWSDGDWRLTSHANFNVPAGGSK
jgi:hypothetical protein